MEGLLLGYIESYGLPILVIAACIITLLGILKLCKVFDKISNKEIRKCVFLTIDLALAFGLAAVYFALFNKPFSGYLVYSGAQFVVTVVLYAMYENWGVRKFVQFLLALITKWFKSDKTNKFKKLAIKLGLDQAIATINKAIAEEADKKAKQAASEVKK